MALTKEKREQRRIELAVKNTFIVDAFRIVMDSYVNTLGDARCGMSFKVTVRNNNHYLVFEDFGQRFAINIYTNGNVEIRMRERNHCVYKEMLFEYTKDINDQADFLNLLKQEWAPKLIEIALERVSSYADFMDILFEGVGVFDAYNYFEFERYLRV